jgi:hypothetical protein
MISLILILLFGVTEAAKDILSFRYRQSIFYNYKKEFWHPQFSWINKYKESKLACNKSPWYYFGLYTPRYTEKFPFSTTFLVFITDGWHLIKALSLIFLFGSIVFYSPIINIWGDIWIYFVAYSISFNFFENNLLQK